MKATINKPGTELFSQPPVTKPFDQLDQGEQVEVIDSWHRISVDGREAFVRAEDLTLETAGTAPSAAVSETVAASPLVAITRFSAERFIGDPVMADADFQQDLEQLNRWAAEQGIRIYITHSFRRRDRQPDGAIVPPAKRSNHLVGHAIDMNLQLDSGDWFNSRRLARDQAAAWPAPIRAFIDAIRGHERLRWGGDFTRTDPVHIDDNLYNRNEDLWMRKYEALVLEEPA